MSIFKGFRTYIFAVIVAVEPILQAALSDTSIDFGTLGRQALIAAIFIALRTVTTTPPGQKS